ncbi:MAG: RES family NAD+ phosphorylase [Wenzhouxiangellaceae bacterium]
MAKFPNPPDVSRLRQIAPDLAQLDQSTQLWRVYFASGPFPTTWYSMRYVGPTDSRFDHHLDPRGLSGPQVRGITYVAGDPVTALAETFQSGRIIDLRRHDPWLAAFSLDLQEDPLTVLDLTGPFATRMGASMAIGSGPRPRARAWARRLYDAYPDAHGIKYCSAMHANNPCFALNERAQWAITPQSRLVFNRALGDPCILHRIKTAALRLGYAVL